jgi:hypothetical protein
MHKGRKKIREWHYYWLGGEDAATLGATSIKLFCLVSASLDRFDL